MKKIFNVLAISSILMLSACNLDLYPVTSYNEGNVEVNSKSESQYSSRADMEGLRNSLYNSWMKDIQEKDALDWLVYTECRADNAYCGNPTTNEIVEVESNKISPDNYNIARDWDWYLEQVSNANQIICNIEGIAQNDKSLTEKEVAQWKSEALIWRAYILYKMSMLWGDVPMVTVIPPAITAENIEEVYSEYYPSRQPIADVYTQIISDLEYAKDNAPDVDSSNKMLMSKAVARVLLARLYAEKTCQDWNKVAQYCQEVEDMGFELCDNYGDLWAYDDTDANRNTKESILEVTWSRSNGNWLFMMFHRNAYDPNDSFTWIKWVTPSRDLIKAYEKEGDTERLNASVIYDECSWSNYYPAEAYAFMHKLPTNASSWILMRLGEVYLLHAEALAMLGDAEGAAGYVNKIRERAGLSELKAGDKTSDTILASVLHERRLELAFEGFRFYDLVRHDMAADVCANVVKNDSHWFARNAITSQNILMPVPLTAIENNPSLTQNEGY